MHIYEYLYSYAYFFRGTHTHVLEHKAASTHQLFNEISSCQFVEHLSYDTRHGHDVFLFQCLIDVFGALKRSPKSICSRLDH